MSSALRSLSLRSRPEPQDTLTARLERVLSEPVAFDAAPIDAHPTDDRDAITSLLSIYDLWTAPIGRLGGREAHQADPEIVRVKARLDAWFMERLDLASPPRRAVGEDAVSTMRRIARGIDVAGSAASPEVTPTISTPMNE